MEKNKIHKYIVVLLSCLCWIHSVSSLEAQNVAEIMDKAVKAYEQSKGLTATFTMNARSVAQGNSESFEGTIDIKGEKFVLKTPDMITWYDGEKQWVYLEQTEEVNLTVPEGEDLQMTNPSYLLKSYKKGFKASFKGESTAPNGKAAYDIELIPKIKKDVKLVTLQVEKYSGLPVSIRFDMKNDMSSSIKITRIVTGVDQPDDFFIFNENDYPEAEVIDLR